MNLKSKLSSAVALGLATQFTYAQADLESDPASSSASVENIVVTGARFGQRFAVDSPTPVDSLTKNDLQANGALELQNMLRVVAPSFNTVRPVTSGVADFLQSPTLRGLSTGQVLVLLNGHRRHINSDLIVGNQLGRGDVAYNFNAIPIVALKRVEILRDGASAQYGSDAVAGIVNIILDDSEGGVFSATHGVTTKGDGDKTSIGVGYGWSVSNDGFFRISGQFDTQEFSNRSRIDTRQQYFGNNGSTPISDNFGSGIGLTPSNGTLDPREQTIDRKTFIFGQPKRDSYSFFANYGISITENVAIYGFGGYSDLAGVNPNFFRRAGQNETVRAIHPNGFIPFQEVDLVDYSGAFGLKGHDLYGFTWDLSTVYGTSKTDLAYSNSNNVSFGLETPTNFRRGGTRLHQWTNKLDLTRQIELGHDLAMNLAFGLEYRDEKFKAVEGELLSYSFGGVPILDGPNTGRPAPAGAQPAGGTSPEEAVDEGRNNLAFYVEAEQEWYDRFLLSLAARHEDYSDFGSSTDYKVAARYSLNDKLNLRSSAGTSFRAPALPQQFFQRNEVAFGTGLPVLTRIVSTNSDLAPLIGASKLKAETANNISIGGTYNRSALTASVDFYQIKLKDRIVLSSQFSGGALTNLLRENGFGETRAVTFLTNGVDTTTQGVDVNVGYSFDFLEGILKSSIAANFSESKIDRLGDTPSEIKDLGISTGLLDLRSQTRLIKGNPDSKIALNFNWSKGAWLVNLTATRYGKVSQADLTNLTQTQVDVLTRGYDTTKVRGIGSDRFDVIETFGAKVITDLSVGYTFMKNITFRVGVDNIFDVYPDEQVATTVESTLVGARGSDNTGIFPYSSLSPFGVAGAYFYSSVNIRF